MANIDILSPCHALIGDPTRKLSSGTTLQASISGSFMIGARSAAISRFPSCHRAVPNHRLKQARAPAAALACATHWEQGSYELEVIPALRHFGPIRASVFTTCVFSHGSRSNGFDVLNVEGVL